MSETRRYTDDEVEQILARAAERSAGLPARASDGRDERGLTLGELQEIGEEVGISPAVVAEAASSLDRTDAVERSWGLPLSVSRTVPLGRPLADREWERLVAELRETFGARGKVRGHGGLREWYNGNLHALIEPTDDGYQLRMSTTKGSAQQLMGIGTVLVLMMAVTAVLTLLGRVDPAELGQMVTILGVVAAAAFGGAAVQLPGWARTRRRQMEMVGRYVEEMVGELPPGESDPT